MANLSSIRQLQEQFGSELVAALVQEIPLADLESALLDESNPLPKDLQTAVMAAVDAGRRLARQIVVMALERVLRERGHDRR